MRKTSVGTTLVLLSLLVIGYLHAPVDGQTAATSVAAIETKSRVI